MLEPKFVQFHDGEGGSHLFLVARRGAEEHVAGFVLVLEDEVPEKNEAGLQVGVNPRSHIGRGDVSKGASWSPLEEGDE